MKVRIFGLTGGIGSGKSTVAAMFRAEGIPVVDADAIAREITAPGQYAYLEIVHRFGRGILREDGAIDRARLGEIVFSDPVRRAELEAVTHPRIVEGIAYALQRLDAEGHAAAIVEAALIHEKGRGGMFEAVIGVRCERSRQIRRLMERDGITEEKAALRLAAQMDGEAKADASDYVIDNSGDLSSTRAQVRALAGRLKRPAPRNAS
ncbi:MAG: dephospho-CoA kinase [Gemmatimonadota bacterium]